MSFDACASYLVIPGTPEAVRNGLLLLGAQPPLCNLTKAGRSNAEIVLAEILNNIVEHAYANSSGVIEVTLAPSADGTFCQIKDQGAEFPDGKLPHTHLPKNAALNDPPEGGFGWFLIRSLTTDLTYDRRGSRNRLSFTLPSEPR